MAKTLGTLSLYYIRGSNGLFGPIPRLLLLLLIVFSSLRL